MEHFCGEVLEREMGEEGVRGLGFFFLRNAGFRS